MSTRIDDSGLHRLESLKSTPDASGVQDLRTGERVPSEKVALAARLDQTATINPDALKAVRQTQIDTIELIYRALIEKYEVDESEIAALPSDISQIENSFHGLLRIMRFLILSRTHLITSELAEDVCETAEEMLKAWHPAYFADLARRVDLNHDVRTPVEDGYQIGPFNNLREIFNFVRAQVAQLKIDDTALLRLSINKSEGLHS